MTVTVAKFRADFTAFARDDSFPNSEITFWLDIAYQLLNAQRWSTLLDFGAELFVAHNLALELKTKREGENGASPGGTVGPINNKSVDKVTVGYDTASGVELEAGHWNLTIYGTRFIRMARMMGAGPVQVGAGSPDGVGAGAYAGPWTFLFPNPVM